MHVITQARLRSFWENHPDAKNSLAAWYKIATSAKWQNFAELKRVFPSADQVKNLTVFNIRGNQYRLIVFVDYRHQKIFIRHVLTHQDYNRDKWKEDPWHG